MVKFSEISEKKCVKERYPHLIAGIPLVQHCADISTIAELLFCLY